MNGLYIVKVLTNKGSLDYDDVLYAVSGVMDYSPDDLNIFDIEPFIDEVYSHMN